MANDDARNVARAWELMKKIGFAMLVTRDGDKLRARPMSAYCERDENAIYFLTDARRHKDEEIARNPGINLSFADASSQKYVSLFRMIAPRSRSCSVPPRKHGGTVPTILISACSRSPPTMQNSGIRRARSSLM
jgi:hypothetical protein